MHKTKISVSELQSKNNLSAFLFVAIPIWGTMLFAQAPDVMWTRYFGNSDTDRAYSVQQTTDGGYIICGHHHSISWSDDVYLVKTNTIGDPVWSRLIRQENITQPEVGYAVQQTSDGGYIITGYDYDVWTSDNVLLAKTNSSGITQWIKIFGGDRADRGYSVQQTTDGGYIVAGYRYHPTNYDYDLYLIKTDADGTAQWERIYGGGDNDYGYSVQQTADGGFIMVGYTYTFDVGGGDVYLVKTNASGTLQWYRTFGGPDTDVGHSVLQTSDGGYIIAGYTRSYGAGAADVYLIKTDANGFENWSRTYGGDSTDMAYSVQEISTGGYVITGETKSFGAGRSDVYVVRTKENGDVLWTKTIGGSSTDCGQSIRHTSDTGFIIGGYTSSFGAGAYDFYLIKTDPEDITAPSSPVLVSPPDNSYTSDTSITFSWHPASDVGLGVKNYTLQIATEPSFSDPMEITQEDTTYIIALPDTTYYWRVLATDYVNNNSAWSSVWTLTIDTQTPIAPTLVYPTGGIYLNDTLVAFEWSEVLFADISAGTGTRAAPVRYILELDTIDTFNSPITTDTFDTNNTLLICNEGDYYWRVKAYDLAGNQSSFSDAGTFGVDITAPTIPSLVSPSDNAYFSDSLIVFTWLSVIESGSGLQNYTLQISLDQSFTDPTEIIQTDTTHTITLSDSTYYWRVQATDNVNNNSSWSPTWTFTIDTQAPITPTLVYPTGGIYLNDTLVAFEWSEVLFADISAGTGTRAAPVRYILELDTIDTFSSVIVTDTFDTNNALLTCAEGFFYWRIKAFDLAGNQSQYSGASSFGVDITPPTTPSLVSPLNSSYFANNSITFTWHPVIESGSGLQDYKLQISLDESFTDPIEINTLDTTSTITLTDTTFFWRVQAIDNANNYSNWSSVWTFTIDTQSPITPTLVYPTDGIYLNNTFVTFEWSEVVLAKTSLGAGTRAAPVRYILELDTIDTFNSPIITDTLDTTTTTLNCAEGFYYWRIKAFDLAGNQSQYSDAGSFGVDITAPTTPSLVFPTDNSYIPDNIITLTWHSVTESGSGLQNYTLQIALDESFADPTEMNTLDTTSTITLTDTTYFWRVRAIDNANNNSNWSPVWTFTIDTQSPITPTLLYPLDSSYVSNTFVTFEWSEVTFSQLSFGKIRMPTEGTRAAPVRYIFELDTIGTFASPITIDTLDTTTTTLNCAEGFYCWRIKAFDLAGNQSQYSDAHTFGVDITAPLIELTTVWVDTNYTGPFTVRTRVTDINGVDSVLLYYKRIEDPSWISLDMTLGGDDMYYAEIPEVSLPDDTVKYYIEAMDIAEPANRSTDPQGAPADYFSFIANSTGIEENNIQTPQAYYLGTNSPNPFRKTTTIQYAIPVQTSVSCKVYNAVGQCVKTLFNGIHDPGYYTVQWNARDDTGRKLPAGIYLYVLESSEFKKINKMVVLD